MLPPLIKAGLPLRFLSPRWVREAGAPMEGHRPREMPGPSLCVLLGRELGAKKETQETWMMPGQKASGTFNSLTPQLTALQGTDPDVLLRGRPLCLPLKRLLRGPVIMFLLMLIARG